MRINYQVGDTVQCIVAQSCWCGARPNIEPRGLYVVERFTERSGRFSVGVILKDPPVPEGLGGHVHDNGWPAVWFKKVFSPAADLKVDLSAPVPARKRQMEDA